MGDRASREKKENFPAPSSALSGTTTRERIAAGLGASLPPLTAEFRLTGNPAEDLPLIAEALEGRILIDWPSGTPLEPNTLHNYLVEGLRDYLELALGVTS